LASVALFAGVASCGGPGDPGHGVGGNADPILGGNVDITDTAVFGIVDLVSGTMADICTGTLIAPNAILTARHCVTDLGNLEMNTSVDCASAMLGAVRPVNNFFVTNEPTLPTTASSFRRVREIVTLPDTGNELCGADVAILILTEPVPSDVAQPLVPAISDDIQSGLAFSAVGYGETSDGANDAGTRHRRDGLRVSCAAGGCGTSQVTDGEFAGTTGICPGDSGGPALDADGNVIGVASRSGSGCSLSIFQNVASHIDFLRDTVIHAASVGGFTPPDWTIVPDGATPTPTPSPGNSLTSSGGCGMGGRHAVADGALLVVALWFAGRLRRGFRRR
jgi:hypothetical protein